MINVHAAESGLPRVCRLPQNRPQSGGARGRASGKPDQQCLEVAAWAVLSSGMGALSIFDPRPAEYRWPIAAASSVRMQPSQPRVLPHSRAPRALLSPPSVRSPTSRGGSAARRAP
jgi:hypothetical protein